jgi:hypothetical protein
MGRQKGCVACVESKKKCEWPSGDAESGEQPPPKKQKEKAVPKSAEVVSSDSESGVEVIDIEKELRKDSDYLGYEILRHFKDLVTEARAMRAVANTATGHLQDMSETLSSGVTVMKGIERVLRRSNILSSRVERMSKDVGVKDGEDIGAEEGEVDEEIGAEGVGTEAMEVESGTGKGSGPSEDVRGAQ